MNLPDFLTEHPYGAIRLTGTRIGLEHVLELYKNDYSAELIQEDFDHLPLEQIQQVIAYYLAIRAEVDAYLKQCQDKEDNFIATHPPSPALLCIRRLLVERRTAVESGS